MNRQSRLGIAVSSPLRAGRPGPGSSHRDCTDQNQSPEKFQEVAEHGDFKNKRAAHYNEYKLGTLPSVQMAQSIP
jgi:hypothetical protein